MLLFLVERKIYLKSKRPFNLKSKENRHNPNRLKMALLCLTAISSALLSAQTCGTVTNTCLTNATVLAVVHGVKSFDDCCTGSSF